MVSTVEFHPIVTQFRTVVTVF